MNRCPVKTCRREIGEDLVACRRHWFKVPAGLRNKVWQLFRREQGSDLHRAAVFEAIEFLAAYVEAPAVKP